MRSTSRAPSPYPGQLMSRSPEVVRLVSGLVGTWAGQGEGGYPTIEPFRYREILEVTGRSDHPALHYQQQTWRETPEGEEPSHWETGFLRISSDGTLTGFNAQGGRAEAMTGVWVANGDTWVITLEGYEYAGDDRVIKSVRTLTLDADFLSYRMSMLTSATIDPEPHLRASLNRVS